MPTDRHRFMTGHCGESASEVIARQRAEDASPSTLPSDPPEAAQVLASCPFCGAHPSLGTPNFGGDWYARCGCGAETRSGRSKAEAIAAWNRRPVAAAADQVGEVERLREIAALAKELVSPAGMVNRGVDRGLVIVESADNSDPHYRLCSALDALDAAALALQVGAAPITHPKDPT